MDAKRTAPAGPPRSSGRSGRWAPSTGFARGAEAAHAVAARVMNTVRRTGAHARVQPLHSRGDLVSGGRSGPGAAAA
jgi:hypothetical protein